MKCFINDENGFIAERHEIPGENRFAAAKQFVVQSAARFIRQEVAELMKYFKRSDLVGFCVIIID